MDDLTIDIRYIPSILARESKVEKRSESRLDIYDRLVALLVTGYDYLEVMSWENKVSYRVRGPEATRWKGEDFLVVGYRDEQVKLMDALLEQINDWRTARCRTI